MMLEKNIKILIVGLGLLGGSYARALTGRGFSVSAVDIRQEAIAYALEKKIIAAGAAEPDPALVGEADLVVFALYPHVLFDWLERYQGLLKPGALLTDVTGVKGTVVERVQTMLRPDLEFIAAHPMAGREVGGVENSDERIFHGANYIVVPTARNTPRAIALCRELGELLGFARIAELSPAEHDEMIAFVSQLTHCIAVSLMTCNRAEHLEEYTGDSFRDLTRIARINDEMWSELFLLNRDALLRQIDSFTAELGVLRGYLADGDREHMRELMRYAAARRALFDKPDPKDRNK